MNTRRNHPRTLEPINVAFLLIAMFSLGWLCHSYLNAKDRADNKALRQLSGTLQQMCIDKR